jgi:hypothetical protein
LLWMNLMPASSGSTQTMIPNRAIKEHWVGRFRSYRRLHFRCWMYGAGKGGHAYCIIPAEGRPRSD